MICLVNSCHTPDTDPSIHLLGNHVVNYTRLLLLRLLYDGRLLVILVQAARRHLVQAQNALVGVLDQHVLGLGRAVLDHHIRNGAHDAPSVGERKVHLVGEIARLPADHAQDDVLIVCLGVDTRDKAMGLVSCCDKTDIGWNR